jgi:dTDP-L-rhamnose 4-epimerase
MARALHAAADPAARRPVVTGAYRLGDVRHVFADPARARVELGFAAREDFAAGMAEFAEAELRRPAAGRT